MNFQSASYGREEIEGFQTLKELALDFFWRWNRNHCLNEIWKSIDQDLWDLTRNPWVLLQTVSLEKLETLLKDPDFRNRVDELVQTHQEEAKKPTWFEKQYPDSSLRCIAYFSMEYMLGESLPIYSGGLGNVAGDQLKAASDLGLPVVGIGLLYQQGYFRQVIDKDGIQKAFYPYNSPGQLPIVPLRKPNGEWMRMEVHLPGWSVWLRAWEVKVGRVKLLLLDTNDAANFPPHRGITSELYGGDSELRLKQELVLGIGGWRLLTELGYTPEVCHLNEGHAAFAVLERAKNYMLLTGESFENALAITRAGNVFTTHTAVAAGFDRFTPALIEQYLYNYTKNSLNISMNELLALGRLNPEDAFEPFNMAYLAIRGSGSINAVSKLHAKVSRQLFAPLFQRWPEGEIPVSYVTNGIHVPSWSSIEAGELWTEYCGLDCWIKEPGCLEKEIQAVSDEKLWQLRNDQRHTLIEYSRNLCIRMLEARGEKREEIERVKSNFDPHTLTMGFARRFATYKRPNLLLYDRERFIKLLTNPQRPIQLIIAGKAHPADKPGQAMIKEWMDFIWDNPEVRSHIIFLSDYDMHMAQKLVQGVDVWINTPRRPWEACGTSGMKILANGGLNISELDGWWAEAYTPDIGWAIGDGQEHHDDPTWDVADATALYELIENKIVPEFYTRDHNGIPEAWITKIRKSMSQLTSRFSSSRAVRDYLTRHYLPAADAYLKRTQDQSSLGKQLLIWKNEIEKKWNKLRFSWIKVETMENVHTFEVALYLDSLDPNAVKVEIYAGDGDELAPIIQEMQRISPLPKDPYTYLYRTTVKTAYPAPYFTPRATPRFPTVATPLEASYILWQK
jgi:starch phosphorylase